MAFDATPYETLPQTNVAGTLALIRAVLTASKDVTFPAAKKALKRVRSTGEALRQLYHAAPPAKAESMTREADVSVDRIWSAIDQRLSAYTELGGEDGAEAARVRAILFPQGMAFLQQRYAEQWAEGEAILGRIASEKLDGALDRFVGAAFLRALRQRHASYGEVLGITKTKPVSAEQTSLVEPLRAARAALSTYLRVMVAAVDNGDFDEALALPALAPVVALRNALRSAKKSGAEPTVAPAAAAAEPLPPVD